MKVLYLDCGMGAAGDMLAAALLELLPDADSFVSELNALGLPGVEVRREESVKCGVRGTHLAVLVRGAEEESEDVLPGHGHEESYHHHHHGHPHVSRREVEERIAALPVPERVREHVRAVYDLVAQAESAVHGVKVGEIHFHELGALDALVDITAVCLLMDRLAPDRVVASPVRVGSGSVRCAHGILPVPAPATARLLEGIPVYGGEFAGELCTPTGAALLRHFVTEFGSLPSLRVQAVGYGMGKKDFPAANCVRALLGEAAEEKNRVCRLACNLDDMTAEEIGFAMDRLYEGGALEAYTLAAGMKKSRPGTVLAVLCAPEDREKMAELLFRHTTTIGVREEIMNRYVLSRSTETAETPLGPVRVKHSAGYGVERTKAEYDDLARLAAAHGMTLGEVRRLIEEKGRKEE